MTTAAGAPAHKGIAGIVLAGGKSSRMGASKALLPWKGRPLVAHMTDILRWAGCAEVFISGAVEGYAGIPDEIPHEGPARAMSALLRRFHGFYGRLLFVPVDMPLLTAEALRGLMETEGDACYAGLPLPAVLRTRADAPGCRAVRGLLESLGAQEIALPPGSAAAMANVNTKAEWEAVTS